MNEVEEEILLKYLAEKPKAVLIYALLYFAACAKDYKAIMELCKDCEEAIIKEAPNTIEEYPDDCMVIDGNECVRRDLID